MQTNTNTFQELNKNRLYGQVWDGKAAKYHFGDKVTAEVEVRVKLKTSELVLRTIPGTILGARIGKAEGPYLTRKCKNKKYAILFDNGHLNSEVPIGDIKGLVKKKCLK